MPVSHIALTVSHLPSSVSFYLSCLQPLDYHFIGQWGESVGLGPSGSESADLFLTQETPESGLKAGTTHIAFDAPFRSAVREFYTAALGAGAKGGEPPAYRNEGTECFNAVVLDLDGNSVEVVCHDGVSGGGSAVGRQNNLLEWREDGASRAAGSAVSRSSNSKALTNLKSISSAAIEVLSAHGGASRARPESTRRSSASAVSSHRDAGSGSVIPSIVRSFTDPLLREAKKADMSEKALIGTVLGAAAGAAVAYAMCKSENDSARAEREYNRLMAERSRPRIDMIDYEQRERGIGRTGRSLLAIEAPPASFSMRKSEAYEPPSYESVVREGSRVKRDDERSRFTVMRSVTSPADLPPNENYDRPSDSRSRSGVTRTSRSRHGSRSSEKPPSVPPVEEKYYYVEGLEDSKTVVPSDSVSCAGSRSRYSKGHSRSSRQSSRREKLDRIDERSERSESTVTPRKYYERSGMSLPVRIRDRDRRRRVASYAG